MSNSQNDNENFFDLEKKFEESLANSVNVDFRNLIQLNQDYSSKNPFYISELETENKNLREKNLSYLEEIQKLQTELTMQDLNNKKNEEKVNFLMQENSKMKSALDKCEEIKIKLNNYEKLDIPNLLKNAANEHQIVSGFKEKLKIIESNYQSEVIDLKRIIAQLKLQIDYLNTNNVKKNEPNNDLIEKQTDQQTALLQDKLAKANADINEKDQEISKLVNNNNELTVHLSKLLTENSELKLTMQSLNSTSINNINNNNTSISNINKASDDNITTVNHSECIKSSQYEELKTKFFELNKTYDLLKEELDAEKTKYVSLLQMNQDLGKKIIVNLKIMNENKSEIAYLKRKVSEQQKEKGEISFNNPENYDDLTNNFELSLFQEDKKKANEIRLSLEKQTQEQKIQIVELTQTIKHNEMRIQSLVEELNLEKMENENLKEIQKSDLKNISKMLSEQSSQNQARKNEEYINELKISLQNTNKINQELANQKKELEKEIMELKNKVKEQQSAFLFFSNENSNNVFRDDKSQAAFSRFSMASNLTQNKFLDTKIKDLEESLIQEKENADNLLKIKQSLIDKLKKSNENLIMERNKINKELSEERMKNKTLQMEKNTLLESEEYLKNQVQELNAETADLRIYQENYELIEEKLEEFQKQFSNLVSNYNNPQIQNENFQKLVNENVELNAFKHKYLSVENELQEKNKEIYSLKEKCFYLEKELNTLKTSQISEFDSNNLNNNDTNKNNNEQLIKELENKIKSYEEEIKELNKNIEDNKLIIFSLREKCKDVIAKEKEIFRLNNVINELNQRKKKRVTFGKDIVVEFKKEESPSEQGNEFQKEPEQLNNSNLNLNSNNNNNNAYYNNEIKQTSINYNNINDLLKSQQDLYQKYQNELDNIRKIEPPAIFMNLNDILKKNVSDNASINGHNKVIKDKYFEDENSDHKQTDNNLDINTNEDDEISKSREKINKNISRIYQSIGKINENIQNQNTNDYSNDNIKLYQQQKNLEEENLNDNQQINKQTKVTEILSNESQVAENIIAALNAPNIEFGNLEFLNSLGSNLDSELSRIKNKYNLNNYNNDDNDSDNYHQVIPNIKDSLDLRLLDKKNKNANKNLYEKNNIPNFMSRSQVSPMNIFDKILQENSITLDNVDNKSNVDDKIKDENPKENLSNSVIVVNSKNQLILKEELNDIPISDEVEVTLENKEKVNVEKQ